LRYGSRSCLAFACGTGQAGTALGLEVGEVVLGSVEPGLSPREVAFRGVEGVERLPSLQARLRSGRGGVGIGLLRLGLGMILGR
jgi:hypothetical protein